MRTLTASTRARFCVFSSDGVHSGCGASAAVTVPRPTAEHRGHGYHRRSCFARSTNAHACVLRKASSWCTFGGEFLFVGSALTLHKASSPAVLVVEDDADTGEALRAALTEELGAPVVVAHDGEEALRVAAELQPSVVLLDIGLPKRDGYEVARALRADPRTSDAWVVALTGQGNPREAARAGFDQYLWKPADVAHVVVAVEAGLSHRRERSAGRRAERALGHPRRPVGEIDRLAEKLQPLVDELADGSESDVASMLDRIEELLAE